MKIHLAIDAVTKAERNLAEYLRHVAGRHAVEHDMYHLGHSQARKAVMRAQTLTKLAERYGAEKPDAEPESGLKDTLRQQASRLMGRSDVAGVMFLADLQHAYLKAQEAEIAWVVLLQGAKARRDSELVEAATAGQEGCETTAKWLRTRIKVTAPQILATA